MNAKIKAALLCTASVFIGVGLAVDEIFTPKHKVVDRCAVYGSEECSISQQRLVSNPTIYFYGETFRSGTTATTTAAF
jgi:uncharacterized protein YlxW (UPF0749 family)